MKSLDLTEVHQIVIDLQTLVGSQLQEVFQSGANVALGFYHERAVSWLWFDLNAVSPVVVRLDQLPRQFKKEIKPLTLFVRSHFIGSRLKAVSTSPELGRVFELHFTTGVLQARVFPRGQNFIATAGEKSVSLQKLKELQPNTPNETQIDERAPRAWQDIEVEWKKINRLDGSKSIDSKTDGDAIAQAERQFKKDLEKKEKALCRMKEDLLSKQNPIFREAGEYLKSISPKDFPYEVPKHLSEVINLNESHAKNIEALFKRAKDNERKLTGSRERIQKLETEINDLRLKGPIGARKKQTQQSGAKKKTLLEAASARGRKFQAAEDLEVYIGKSGADNLALLRKAQPFDYWLHLRDYPGSHAIIRRTRNRQVTDQELQLAGKWVVEQSLHKTPEQLSDQKFDVLLVECRFVRPIKGDKLGRVNYSNDRVFVVRF